MSREEDEYWEGKILEARRGQLDTVRKAAAGWSALLTAVLGAFATVTFASGLTGMNDLPVGVRSIVRIGIAIAAIAVLLATILAGAAANAFPRKTNDLTVDAFRTAHKERATRALKRLKWSMGFGVAGAVVVVAGSFVVLFTDKAPAKPQPVIAPAGGKVYCGVPSAAPDGSLMLANVPLTGDVIVVAKCP
ncbi:hypothetical protein [Actinokineospora fastidiosa]|uniref:hypothetical protein n=1 Tax=Actinokineospora fastidiosa TaxID=1816 RepID=UPI001670B157|nr:hypothetical protein [Actinokineospora fastidiosa]